MEKNVDLFIEKLASKASVPGGGGVAAMAGALGSALASMVCELTIGKPKYATFEEELKIICADAKKLSKEFIQLAEKDEVVFEPLSKAYGLPSGTEEEKAYKDKVMEKCLLDAMLTPFEVVKKGYEALLLLDRLTEKGSKLAISDVGCGAALALSSMESAALNIYINTKFMKNECVKQQYNAETEEYVAKGKALSEKIYSSVKDMIVK